MPSNKDRLYIALHARGGGSRPKMPGKEDTYHWSLTILPKHYPPKPRNSNKNQGSTYHAREIPTPTADGPGFEFKWTFEERSSALDTMVLVRILIGKVVDREGLLGILRGVPVPGEEEGWNYVSWVREALEAISRSDKGVLGSGCVLEWEKIRDKAMGFCQEKKDQHWFDGKVWC